MTSSAVDLFFDQMSRFKVLEAEEVINLSRKVRTWQDDEQGPDNSPRSTRLVGLAARDKLVRHNLRLVVRVWKDSYYARLNHQAAGLADALQNGAMGLVRAAEKYNAATGHKFSTYAITWIHKGFRDYFATEERMVRIPSNNYYLARTAIAIQNKAVRAGLPRPSVEQTHAEMSETRRNMPSARTLEEWMNSYASTLPRSFSDPIGEDATLGDLISDTSTDEREEDVVAERGRYAMQFLTQFERDVLEKRFNRKRGSIGHKRVAQVLKSTEEEVRKAEEVAIARVREIAAVD